jgi:hypothetical protein
MHVSVEEAAINLYLTDNVTVNDVVTFRSYHLKPGDKVEFVKI